jgi:hypothetical protein
MKRRSLLALMLAPFSSRAQLRRKQPEQVARIEVVSLKLQRDGGKITIDGAIRNTGTVPLAKLLLLFDLLDADEKTISRRRGPIEETVLEPEAESSFGFFVPDHARAVSVRLEAEQRERHVEVVKPGPYYFE